MFIDVHDYMVIVTNLATGTGTNTTIAGGLSEYLHTANQEDYCSMLKFCVVSVRPNRVGEVSGCIKAAVRRGSKTKYSRFFMM